MQKYEPVECMHACMQARLSLSQCQLGEEHVDQGHVQQLKLTLRNRLGCIVRCETRRKWTYEQT